MARPIKRGLDYFPLDVDIFEDDKLFYLQEKYGPLGEVIYMRLLCLIYKNGYYYRFDDIEALSRLMIRSVGNRWTRGLSTVTEVILYCAKINLFSAELMRQGVITSPSIQQRYLVVRGRNRSIIEEYNLLENENAQVGLITAPKTQVIAAETGIIAAKTPIIDVETPTERKEKKIKVKERESGVFAASSPYSQNSLRASLIEKYGESNVLAYEKKYRDWQRKKNIPDNGVSYPQIKKWMEQDGIRKDIGKSGLCGSQSSLDMDDVMRELIEQYSEPEK